MHKNLETFIHLSQREHLVLWSSLQPLFDLVKEH